MIKMKIEKENDIDLLLPILRNQIKKNGYYRMDYRYRIREEEIIPQYFLNKLIFNNIESFQQNNYYLGREIRQYINIELMNENKINCIGGESYLYGLEKEEINFYTNNRIIYEDAEYNLKLYKKNYKLYLVDYNKSNLIFKNYPLIINLSKLNIHLINNINKSNINKIYIISCHHNDFWKKIKYLSNYKLIKRLQYLSNNYFLTINLFIKN